MNFPLPKSSLGGRIGFEISRLVDAVNSLRPISTGDEFVSVTTLGTKNVKVQRKQQASNLVRSLVVRHIGIDAMWVSRPIAPGYSTSNYWYWGDSDLSEHFFCLKPPQLQNRYWWDEVGGEAIGSNEFLFVPGPSPQTGLLTVQSVAGTTYDFGSGSFLGIQSRELHQSGPDPEPVSHEFISPPFYAPDDGAFSTVYGGNTTVIGLKIPKGLLVCNEKGKVVWDAWDTFSIGAKPETSSNVTTWGIGEPGSPSGLYSPIKEGFYDIEFIDLNVDGRHWKQAVLSNEQSANAVPILNTSNLDPAKVWALQVVGGNAVWVEVP